MHNFAKIAVLILLAILSVALVFIGAKSGHVIFTIFAVVCFGTLIIAVCSILSEEISVALNKLKRSLFHSKVKISPYIVNHDNTDVSWEKFIENNPIPAITFDENFHIIRKNVAFAELLAKHNMADSKNVQDSFACNVEDFYDTMRKSNYTSSIAGDAILNDNTKTPFTFFAVPISTDNSASKIYFAQFVDNSEKVGLKEKFIQAQKMQAIGQLAGGIAHDFNNLLTAIGGFSDLLLTRHAPGDASFVDIMHIKQNANRAASLVKQLLAFSRKQTMQLEVLNLGEVLSDISNLIRRLIGENIILNVNMERELWDIKADKSQLEQVFINLAVNGRDAMKETSGGKLDIKCQNIDIISSRDIKFKYPSHTNEGDIIPGKYVMISICDSGAGIAKENLKKIFEPFFTTKEIGQGTGLGLATVTGIVEQLGGFIAVSSKEKEGTEFLLFLKRSEKSAIDVKQEEVKKEKAKDLTGSGTILIVEDEEAVRMFSSRALKNKGYNVLEAASGEQAVEIFESGEGDKIDLIISDVVMPGLSGPEFVEIIAPKFPKVKVVFVSGYGEDAFYSKYGMERKFNFLPKPYSLNQLAERVKEILS